VIAWRYFIRDQQRPLECTGLTLTCGVQVKEAGQVFVVSVNDAFVMKAWAEAIAGQSSVRSFLVMVMMLASYTHELKALQFRFLGDPSAEFTKALDLDFDATKIFGGVRSKRYALVVKDGKISSVHVEPDSTGTNESMADNVLGRGTGNN